MRVYRVEIQEVTERSGFVVADSEAGVEAELEKGGYTLHNENVQVAEREVVSVVEGTLAASGGSLALQTHGDGVGAIQPGAYLVWEDSSEKLEQLGTHYFPGQKGPFGRRHPWTVALTEEARVRLARSGHKGAWHLANVSGRLIVLDPVKATAAELEEQFDYPPGDLAHLG